MHCPRTPAVASCGWQHWGRSSLRTGPKHESARGISETRTLCQLHSMATGFAQQQVPQACLHNEHDGTVQLYRGETASPSSGPVVTEPKDEADLLWRKNEEIARLKDQLQMSDMMIENLQQQLYRLERKCLELEATSKKFCLETLKTLEKWCELV
ncbi:uncharacterized protein LOC119461529 [Dermacentor silvarum]|uniref:uncharacterized protein LOC119461529 n=1 Tax=Dermacentor silvarum TaxID=543639 RepID=UPI001899700E|nr:uncharacterized protein LOC119461529 [Dermacentor silvarum]